MALWGVMKVVHKYIVFTWYIFNLWVIYLNLAPAIGGTVINQCLHAAVHPIKILPLKHFKFPLNQWVTYFFLTMNVLPLKAGINILIS